MGENIYLLHLVLFQACWGTVSKPQASSEPQHPFYGMGKKTLLFFLASLKWRMKEAPFWGLVLAEADPGTRL